MTRDHPPDDDDILRIAATPHRALLLEEAITATCGDRNRDYGEPVENHEHIARIFNAWTGHDLTAREVVQVLICVKMARRTTSPTHRDSYVDSMAYAGIEYETALAEGGK
ncbi:MAG: DUF6378 domain-containing protein [Pseudomonadota bacterium]